MLPPKVYSIAELIAWSTRELASFSESARLDSEVLLAHILSCTRLQLISESRAQVDPQIIAKFADLISRRAKHEPVAYLVGQREFWGLDFEVTPDVLIPRPETELIVEQALEWLADHRAARILDLGTGSGCIAIALAHEARSRGKQVQVVAIDTSAAALAVAERNAARHGVPDLIEFRLGNWFGECDSAQEQFDLIATNPPYIAPDDLIRDPGTDYEPAGALFSGVAGGDGLDAVREIVQQLPGFLAHPGIFLCEIGAQQGSAARQLVPHGFKGEILRDLAGRERVLRVFAK